MKINNIAAPLLAATLAAGCGGSQGRLEGTEGSLNGSNRVTQVTRGHMFQATLPQLPDGVQQSELDLSTIRALEDEINQLLGDYNDGFSEIVRLSRRIQEAQARQDTYRRESGTSDLGFAEFGRATSEYEAIACEMNAQLVLATEKLNEIKTKLNELLADATSQLVNDQIIPTIENQLTRLRVALDEFSQSELDLNLELQNTNDDQRATIIGRELTELRINIIDTRNAIEELQNLINRYRSLGLCFQTELSTLFTVEANPSPDTTPTPTSVALAASEASARCLHGSASNTQMSYLSGHLTNPARIAIDGYDGTAFESCAEIHARVQSWQTCIDLDRLEACPATRN